MTQPLLVLAAACRPPLEVTAAVSPAGDAAPLTFVLRVDATEAVSAEIRWTDGDWERRIALPEAQLVDDQPLIGFRPGTVAEVEVVVTDARGRTAAADPVEVTVPELPPEDRPLLEVLASEPDRMSPGPTLVSRWGGGAQADGVALLSPQGELVYLLRAGDDLTDARAVGDHLQLLVGKPSVEIREVDWLGRPLRTFHSAGWGGGGVAVDTELRFHHDAVALDDGGYVVLGKRVRPVEGFPLSYDDPSLTATVDVAEDVLLRFDADGAPVWERPLGDVLDLRRIAFDSLAPSREDQAPDWAHANAVWVEPDGAVGVSLRHQDAVVRLDPDGALDWILGAPGNWAAPWADHLLSPEGDVEWPSHQHGARLEPDGTIDLFDNGNARALPGEVPFAELPPETERHSTSAGFQVDPARRTVSQVRRFDLVRSVGGDVFSEALGSSALLDNGNQLAVFGRIVAEDGQSYAAIVGAPHGVRVVEWDPSGAEVFHVHLTTDPDGWDCYRVQRLIGFPGD